jgi:hypothetical protein
MIKKIIKNKNKKEYFDGDLKWANILINISLIFVLLTFFGYVIHIFINI